MSNSDARGAAPTDGARGFSLYAPRSGARKYLNRPERLRVLAAMRQLPADEALFALTLAWTGARVSEALSLTPASFQVESGIVSIRTLKRRRATVRELPISPALMAALEQHFGICAAQRAGAVDHRLWPWSRATAWRRIKRVMNLSGVAGPQACPRGLRHGFAVGVLQAGIPLTLAQRWLGHARLSTTAIYADVSGPEEAELAARFWRSYPPENVMPLAMVSKTR